MIRFDAYSATTTHANHGQLVDLLRSCAAGPVTMTGGKGFHSFADRVSIKDDTGSEYGSVSWGGRQGDRCMIEVKGEQTPAAVVALRERYYHRVTRADSCADFDAPGAFERLLSPCLAIKAKHRLKGAKFGDWEDFPEDGRTLYLGAPTSAVRLRLYEKGKQPEYRHLSRPDWVRMEIQARPAKEAKAAFNHLSAADVWGSSTWSRELAAEALQAHIDPHPAGTVFKHTEREAALRWMCKQYGSHLVSLAADLGNWECVGLTLAEIIKANKTTI